MNAPHVKCSVVMPGHIGTDIVTNSRKILSSGDVDVAAVRKALAAQGGDLSGMSDEQVRAFIDMQAKAFHDMAPTTAAPAPAAAAADKKDDKAGEVKK